MNNPDVTVEDGKYTFQQPDGDWKIHVLRYGEPWLVIESGHSAIASLLEELRESKVGPDVCAAERNALAAQAMQGMLARGTEEEFRDLDGAAEYAYVVADAMIKAREADAKR